MALRAGDLISGPIAQRGQVERTRLRRLVWVVVGIAGALAIVSHILPMLTWLAVTGPDLRGQPEASRLRVETLRAFGNPGRDWQPLRVGNLSLSVPPGAEMSAECAEGGANCFLEVGGGSVNVFVAGHLEPYADMLLLRAPDERDLSWLRSPQANWSTIEALRDRVQTSRANLESFRFRTSSVKGVVARSVREGRTRWVVAAYSLDESQSRGVGVAGIPKADFHRILGSLAFPELGSR